MAEMKRGTVNNPWLITKPAAAILKGILADVASEQAISPIAICKYAYNLRDCNIELY